MVVVARGCVHKLAQSNPAAANTKTRPAGRQLVRPFAGPKLLTTYLNIAAGRRGSRPVCDKILESPSYLWKF